MNEPNIVFIVVDALRARNLFCYGYPKPTSCNIDQLAKEGVLFENAYSCANVTDSSMTTIFSGMFPISHGILNQGQYVGLNDIQELDRRNIKFLPEFMKTKGYKTLAIDWIGRWHRRGYHYYSGLIEGKWVETTRRAALSSVQFFKPVLRKLSNLDRWIDWKLSFFDAKIVTDHAIALIERNLKQKFFLLVHYWDTHADYNPPPSWTKLFYEEEPNQNEPLNPYYRTYNRICRPPNEGRARYDGAIAYVDEQIGRLIKFLKQSGIFDETMLVLTSDHGESLTEHSIYYDHHGLYDVSVHIPLILRYCNLPKNKRVQGFVQHCDVLPTILELLGFDWRREFDGMTTIPLINDEKTSLRPAIFLEERLTEKKSAIRTKKYKYIRAESIKVAKCRYCGHIHGGIEELYDLKKDPEENVNIAQQEPEISKRLQDQLLKFSEGLKRKHKPTKMKSIVRPLDYHAKKRVIEHLRELGYL